MTRQTKIMFRSMMALGILMATFSAPSVAVSQPTKAQIERAKKINAAKIKKRRAASRNGAYITGGVGLIGSGTSAENVDLSDGTGLGIGVGYRFTPQLAVEGGLLLGQYNVQTGEDTDNTNQEEASLLGATLNLKYFMPIQGNRVEGYGQIGLGTLRIENLGDSEVDGTIVELGGGIDYRVSKEFAVGAKVGYMHMLENEAATNADDFSALNGMITLSFQL